MSPRSIVLTSSTGSSCPIVFRKTLDPEVEGITSLRNIGKDLLVHTMFNATHAWIFNHRRPENINSPTQLSTIRNKLSNLYRWVLKILWGMKTSQKSCYILSILLIGTTTTTTITTTTTAATATTTITTITTTTTSVMLGKSNKNRGYNKCIQNIGRNTGKEETVERSRRNWELSIEIFLRKYSADGKI